MEHLKDILFDITGKRDYSNTELAGIFRLLPEDIRNIALQWGMNDTDFRDCAYKWFEANQESIKYLFLTKFNF